MYVVREKELRIGREPARKTPCRVCSTSRDVGNSAVPFSFPFVVSLSSKVGLGGGSVPPYLPIRAHRMEDSGRSSWRHGECDFTNDRWISVDRNRSRLGALRWRPIRSLEFPRWETFAVR